MLRVADLSVRYGRIRAVDGVSLRVRPGEVLLVAGLNGAGKSSLVRAIAGLTPPAAGQVHLHGRAITGRPLHRLAGVALVPEGRILASSLTVDETLMLGAGKAGAAARRARRAGVLDRFPELGRRLGQRAGTLSGGEATMLALGRALMADPALVLLDEPTLGLSPAAAERVFDTVASLRADGLGLLLVEQSLHRALALADRLLLLRQGRSVHEGPADTKTGARAMEDLMMTDETKGATPC